MKTLIKSILTVAMLSGIATSATAASSHVTIGGSGSLVFDSSFNCAGLTVYNTYGGKIKMPCMSYYQWAIIKIRAELQMMHLNKDYDSSAAGKEAGRKECTANPKSCDIEVGLSQKEVDIQVKNAKDDAIKACKEKPASCGITVASLGGYTQEQFDGNLDVGLENGKKVCQDDPTSCGIMPMTVGLSPTMGIHLNEIEFVGEDGNSKIWADMQMITKDGKVNFELTNYGLVTGPDMDGDGYDIAMGDCNDSDPSINPGVEEIEGDGINQDCQISAKD